MRKGVLKVTACCLAGTLVFSGTGVVTMASGIGTPLVGLESRIEEREVEKAAAGTIQVEAKGYQTVAIARLNEADGYVNIRDAASVEEGKVLGKLYHNSAATILGAEGDWYLIQSGSVTGYVKKDFFVTGQEAKVLSEEVGESVATVKTTTLMVREKPNKKSTVLAMVGDSEQLQVLGREKGWVKVAIDDDVVGYVKGNFVDCETKYVEAESKEEEEVRVEREEAAYRAFIAAAEKADNAQNTAAESAWIAAVTGSLEEAWAAVYAADQAVIDAWAAAEEQPTAENIAAAEATESHAADARAEAERLQREQENGTPDEAPIQTPETPEAEAPVESTPETEAPVESAPEAEAPVETTPETEAPAPEAAPPAETSATRQNIVSYALQFVGNPYVWGGTSLTNGADCSGFTQSVLKAFGIYIPRVAQDQCYGGGREVSLSNIQPGDLLFYSNGGGIGHVSMYIGNGQVVHASNSRTGIIISPMSYRTPCAARNYID